MSHAKKLGFLLEKQSGDMAKLADALDLGSSGETRASSSLVISTKLGILILIQSINIKPIQIASEMALF